MTSDQFKIQSAYDVAVWFKYLNSRSERDGCIWFKDVRAKQHYEKFKRTYDNVYTCLVNEGVDVKEFVTSYFKRKGMHSPRGLESLVEDRCSKFYKNVRAFFKKTVKNVCVAMLNRSMSSSLSVVDELCRTGMLAPNFLAGKISAYWLAGVPGIDSKLKGKIRNKPFKHGDDFNSTFDRFLNQREVYYHILCRAFDRMDSGVNSLAVTDRYFESHMNGRES